MASIARPAQGNNTNRRLTKTTVQSGSVISAGHAASLTTALTGTNNDLVYDALGRGTGGNSVTVTYVVAGASTALTVSVSGNAITVNVATDGASAATSTAAQVAAAVAASAPATALVRVSNAAGNDGTGVVTAMSVTSLAGGSATVTGATGVGIRRGQRSYSV